MFVCVRVFVCGHAEGTAQKNRTARLRRASARNHLPWEDPIFPRASAFALRRNINYCDLDRLMAEVPRPAPPQLKGGKSRLQSRNMSVGGHSLRREIFTKDFFLGGNPLSKFLASFGEEKAALATFWRLRGDKAMATTKVKRDPRRNKVPRCTLLVHSIRVRASSACKYALHD